MPELVDNSATVTLALVALTALMIGGNWTAVSKIFKMDSAKNISILCFLGIFVYTSLTWALMLTLYGVVNLVKAPAEWSVDILLALFFMMSYALASGCILGLFCASVGALGSLKGEKVCKGTVVVTFLTILALCYIQVGTRSPKLSL